MISQMRRDDFTNDKMCGMICGVKCAYTSGELQRNAVKNVE